MKFDSNGVEAITIGRDEFEPVDGVFDIPDNLIKSVDLLLCFGLTKSKEQAQVAPAVEEKKPGRRR